MSRQPVSIAITDVDRHATKCSAKNTNNSNSIRAKNREIEEEDETTK